MKNALDHGDGRLPEMLRRESRSGDQGASFAQAISGCTGPNPAKVPIPQSVPAITRSGPTNLA